MGGEYGADIPIPFFLAVHPRERIADARPYAFLSIDRRVSSLLSLIPHEGMNDRGLTISPHSLRESRFWYNTVGVLTNDPPFEWHLRNLNNYVAISPEWPAVSPGGASSPPRNKSEAVDLATALLNSMHLIKGSTPHDPGVPITSAKNFGFTQFSVLKIPQSR
eukprot:gene5225-33934_t